MFSTIFKGIGQLIGELTHQSGNLVDDIIDTPNAFMKGYEEEIFETKPKASTTKNVAKPVVDSTKAKFRKMTVKSLRAYAKENGTDLGKLRLKADLIAKIIKG